jgi:hypothetical protein
VLPNLNIPANPTCGVVVEKDPETQEERVCGAEAAQLVTMVDPETKTKVTAILLVCHRHDEELEAGKTLIFLSDDGSDHIAVTYKEHKEELENDAEPDATA